MLSPSNLKALRFIYHHGKAEHSFETMKFYTVFLRGFLRNNWGKAVWFVGWKIERPAYLLYETSLDGKIQYMLKTPLEDMGNYDIRTVDVMPLLQQYRAEARVIKGYLNLDPPIKGDIPLQEGERLLALQKPFYQGDFAIDFDRAVYTPGDEYWKNGMVTFYNAVLTSPWNPNLHDERERYWIDADYVRAKGIAV